MSVIIPTWNRASVLPRALKSVQSQSLKPQEIIVVNDGSTDHTKEIVESRFPQVHLIEQTNRGVSAARNAGIAASNSEFIALLDSDDEWLPKKLERQLNSMLETPNSVLSHTDEIWIRNGHRVNPMKKHRKYGGHIFQHCLPRCVISPSSVVMNRSLIKTIGLFDENLPACEDYDFWLRVTAVFPVIYLAEPLLIKYGGHQDQLSKRYWGMDRFRIQAIAKLLDQEILTGTSLEAATAMLQHKITIYASGAKKRGKLLEAQRYESGLSP